MVRYEVAKLYPLQTDETVYSACLRQRGEDQR